MPDTPDSPQPPQQPSTPQPAPVPQPAQPAPAPAADPYAAFRPPGASPSTGPAGQPRPGAARTGGRWVQYEPMERPGQLSGALEDLLKHPGRIIYEMQQKGRGKLFFSLLGLILVSLLIYGLVVATFAGGWNFLISPLKIILGLGICYVITLPSLYIFTCLGGADVTFKGVAGLFLGALALMSILLISFAPVSWIFSQSTNSLALMTFLHGAFWVVGLLFGMKILYAAQDYLKSSGTGQLFVWTLIFTAVCLQMMTTLRPIVGRNDLERVLPTEKKFFLQHWWEVTFTDLADATNLDRMNSRSRRADPDEPVRSRGDY